MDYCKNCKRWTCGAQGTSHEMTIPCGNYIPPTNYDLLVSKTPEELAKLFVSGWYDGPLFTCPVKDDGCESDVSCDVCFLNWLKSPVKEVDNE